MVIFTSESDNSAESSLGVNVFSKFTSKSTEFLLVNTCVVQLVLGF
jgi:hypothetical protein